MYVFMLWQMKKIGTFGTLRIIEERLVVADKSSVHEW